MIIIVILLVIIIVWLQYPTYNSNCNDNEKEEQYYKQIFNLIKVPIVVICFSVLLWNSFICIKKELPDVYISVPKY